MSDDEQQLYGKAYYDNYLEGLPYHRIPHWLQFFGLVADRIVHGIGPARVLDAGCAMGFLVEALRDRGVEAFGCDISGYAIEQVREDIRPHCWRGSVTDPFPHRYDLIVCIEVLEHLPPKLGEEAVANLCRFSDDILISTTPDGYDEPTHRNVQPPEYWAGQFGQFGYFHDVDFDATFVSPWAMRFIRREEPVHVLIQAFERRIWHLSQHVEVLRATVVATQPELGKLREIVTNLETEATERRRQIDQLQAEVIEGHQQIVQLQTDVAERHQQVDHLQSQLVAMETEGAALRAETKARCLDLERERERTRALLQTTTRLENSLELLVAERTALLDTNARLEHSLGLIESRLSWQLLATVWQYQLRLAPILSRRHHLIAAITRRIRSARRVAAEASRLRGHAEDERRQ